MLYLDSSKAVGNTPLLQASRYSAKTEACNAVIFAKLEMFNPAGSIKDRVALSLIEDAEASGILREDSIILEPTSGNTGIGLASIAAAKGYRALIVMPDSVSVERRAMIQAYGAEVALTPGELAVKGSIAYANDLAASDSRYVILGQFTNPANPKIHYETTGPEIYRDLDGQIAALVATVGTGGTISGVGKYLKEQNPEIYVVAVEPASSPFLSTGKSGSHGIQGIGAGFAPEVLDQTIYNEIITVTDEDSYLEARAFSAAEGFFVGISSGAALRAALELGSRVEFAGKNIVAILPDSGDRYLSTALCQFPEIETTPVEM